MLLCNVATLPNGEKATKLTSLLCQKIVSYNWFTVICTRSSALHLYNDCMTRYKAPCVVVISVADDGRHRLCYFKQCIIIYLSHIAYDIAFHIFIVFLQYPIYLQFMLQMLS